MNVETLHELTRERVRERMREAREARFAAQLRRPEVRRRPRASIALLAHALAIHREAAAR